MKLFCAYASADETHVLERLGVVVGTLGSAGHDAYCDRFNADIGKLYHRGDFRGIFTQAFKRIKKSDGVVVVVASANRSIGQLMEVGVAISQGKPVYLFIHRSVAKTTYLPTLADKYFVWEDMDQLRLALQQLEPAA